MISVCFFLTLLTLISRVGPLIIGDLLSQKAWFQRLANGLPALILVLILFQDLEHRLIPHPENSLPILAGVLATLLAHSWKKEVILSIIAGVGAYCLVQILI